MNEWPKSLYRPAKEGGVESRSFASEADIPAKEGWTDFKSAKAASTPVAPPASKDARETERLQKQITDLMQKVQAGATQQAAEKAAAEAIRATALAAEQRVADLEAFIGKLATDDNCPPALKAAISEMLSPDTSKRARAARKTAAA